MNLVDAPSHYPHHAIPDVQSERGYVDCGDVIPDVRVYLTYQGTLEAARLFGMVTREEHQEALDRAVRAEAEAAAARSRLDEVEQFRRHAHAIVSNWHLGDEDDAA